MHQPGEATTRNWALESSERPLELSNGEVAKDHYFVSVDNTANNSYYEYADGNVDGIEFFGETYKVIWWQNGLDVQSAQNHFGPGGIIGAANLVMSVNAWIPPQTDLVANVPELTKDGLVIEWDVTNAPIPAGVSTYTQVFLSEDDVLDASDISIYSEDLSPESLAIDHYGRTIPAGEFARRFRCIRIHVMYS